MFNEAIEVFDAILKEKGDQAEQWLCDNYIPSPGTYVLLNLEDDFSVRNIFDIGKPDKKTGKIAGMENKDYRLVSFLDKNSKLLTMNKPIDSKKKIHSNNFYAFFVKKESISQEKTELTDEIIQGYFENLANPRLKYTKPKAKSIYEETEKKLEPVNTEVLKRIQEWIGQNFIKFLELQKEKLNLESKDYLKIFFVYSDDETTRTEIKREGERYLFPNIFNNNDYNIKIDDSIFGLHSNNMGLNQKKPFMDNKSRKETIPCAITMDKAVKQYRFMEYLSSQAAKGNYNVYIDFDNKTIQCIQDRDVANDMESGIYFRIIQGKTEVEIHSFERITGFNNNLRPAFQMKEIFTFGEKMKEVYSNAYGTKYALRDVEMLVNEGLFGKYLISNYKTEAKDLPVTMNSLVKEQLQLCREQLWNWFHNNQKQHVGIVLDKACKRLVQDSIESNHPEKAKHQFNLWFSLMNYLNGDRKKEEKMSNVTELLINHVLKTEGEWEFENDEEYFYAVGQMSRYILNFTKKMNKDKKLDMLRPIISVRNDKILKERIVQLVKKYGYEMPLMYKRTNELLAKILIYSPKGKVDEVMIMAGFVNENVLYMSNKKEDAEVEEKEDTSKDM